MRLIYLFFAILSSMPAYSLTQNKLQALNIIQDCNILNMNGDVVRSLPGKMCLFFEDGKFISANEKRMRLYDKNYTALWTIEGHFHHQLALSNDKKRILAFDSGKIDIKGKNKRTDRILVISMEGKILHEQSSDALLKMQKLPYFDWLNSPWLKQETNTEREISHFNSIYEIPKNANDLPGSPLREGNFIVNGLTHGIFVLSPDLKRIVFHKILNTSVEHFIHDVQVTKRGNIIYFNNITAEPTQKNLYSTIQEYDLLKQGVVFEFKASPEAMFFSRYCGAIQELDDDHILFSDKFNGTYIYSRNEKKMFSTIRGTHFQNRLPVYNQSTKAQDLSLFLKNFKR